MRLLTQIALLLSLVSYGQNTIIRPNMPLESLGVEVSLSSYQDTLVIKADKGALQKIIILKRLDDDKTRRTSELTPYLENYYKIPLNQYDVGSYTVEVHYKPHIYPFKMIRVMPIPLDLRNQPTIRSFKALYGVIQPFGARYGQINALTDKKLANLIAKFENDKITRNGAYNWLKIYAIYEDNTENLVYTVE